MSSLVQHDTINSAVDDKRPGHRVTMANIGPRGLEAPDHSDLDSVPTSSENKHRVQSPWCFRTASLGNESNTKERHSDYDHAKLPDDLGGSVVAAASGGHALALRFPPLLFFSTIHQPVWGFFWGVFRSCLGLKI
jgi:hypothetical protein